MEFCCFINSISSLIGESFLPVGGRESQENDPKLNH